MTSAWTISTREEAISALWFIVALLAEANGHRTTAILIAIKASLDMVGALYYAIAETRRRIRESR